MASTSEPFGPAADLEVELQEAQAALIQARVQAREIEAPALARRDRVVGRALDEKISAYRIAKLTGLSPTAVAKIEKRLRDQRHAASEEC